MPANKPHQRYGAFAPLAIIAILAVVWIVVGYVSARLTDWMSGAAAGVSPPMFEGERTIAWSFLLFAAAVGGLTMALVQVCRTLLPLRGMFHRRAASLWFDDGIPPSLAGERTAGSPYGAERAGRSEEAQEWARVGGKLGIPFPTVAKALLEFEERRKERTGAGSRANSDGTAADLANGSYSPPVNSQTFSKKVASYWKRMSLYDLSIEQLCGQMNLALEAALDHPEHFPNFVLLLFGQDGASDLLVIVPEPTKETASEGQTTSAVTASQTPVSPKEGKDIGGTSAESVSLRKRSEEVQSRTALTRLGQFRIDAFQIAAGGRWRRWLRLGVLAVSVAFSIAFCFSSARVQRREEAKAAAAVSAKIIDDAAAAEAKVRAQAISREITAKEAAATAVEALTTAKTLKSRGEAERASANANMALDRAATQVRDLRAKPPSEEGAHRRSKWAAMKSWFRAAVEANRGSALYSLLVGVIGAYLAMLFRDFTAIVESKRRQA